METTKRTEDPEKLPDSDSKDPELKEEKTTTDLRIYELGADKANGSEERSGKLGAVTQKLLTWGIESRGIWPVPRELRKDQQFNKIFFIWFSMNVNILSFSAGTAGPVVYGLSLRDSCLLILFFNLLCCLPPAYFTTWGPKLGLRQMCQARFSFGYYGVIIPSILNCVTMTGFMILNAILGGQTLAAVTDGQLSWSVGIVVISVVSLLVSFCGYRVLSWYERLSWLPVLIVYLVAIGIGSKHLSSPPPAEPATAASVLSFGSVLAGFVLTYSPLSSDFTTYLDADVPSWRIFLYAYLGFSLPIITIQCLGAAFAAATPSVASWSSAYASGSVGNLIEAVLSPAGGFGKFLTVLLSLSVTANIAPTMYSFGLSFQVFLPFCAYLPRYLFSILSTVIVIPLSIAGAHRFYSTLTNFLGLIGYWAACFIAIISVEHFVFRSYASFFTSSSSALNSQTQETTSQAPHSVTSNDPFAAYDVSAWNTSSRLPSGIPALLASILSFGLVVPCMDQVWYIGPIAKTTGDIGFEVALVVTTMLYIPFRYIEIKIKKSL